MNFSRIVPLRWKLLGTLFLSKGEVRVNQSHVEIRHPMYFRELTLEQVAGIESGADETEVWLEERLPQSLPVPEIAKQ
jgi:hypothetical protein